MIGDKKWARCPICTTIFGKMIGDMPDGKMTHYIDKNMKCEGYPPGIIAISYQMFGCKRNGVNVPGTTRNAYLPNN